MSEDARVAAAPIGAELRCHECGWLGRARVRDYESLSAEVDQPLDALIRLTNPGLRDMLARRTEIEQDLQLGLFTPEVRRRLLDACVTDLDYACARELVRRRIGIPHFAAWAISLMVGIVGTTVLANQEWFPPQLFGALFFFWLLWLIGLPFIPIIVRSRGAARRRVEGLMVRAMRPLEPTEGEIAAAIERCEIDGSLAARYAAAPRVHAALHRRP